MAIKAIRYFGLLILALCLSVVLLPSIAFCVGKDFEECSSKQQARLTDPRGDFSKYSFKSVDEALKNPETFWEFITVPGTPYIERRSAAIQAIKALPWEEVSTKWIPRLLKAQDELQAEFTQHYFGLKLPSCWNLAFNPAYVRPGVERKRVILGHEWSLPEVFSEAKLLTREELLKGAQPQEISANTLMNYPLTFDEELTAPWPWQVQQALNDVQTAIYQELDKSKRTEELLSGALTLPVSTDEQARLFVRITHYFSMHHKTFPVLARWRSIGIDPQKPNAAKMVAREIGNDMRMRAMYADPEESRLIGDLMIVDILKNSKEPEVVFNAANSYLDLHVVQEYEKRNGKVIPESPSAVKLITEAVLDPRMGDDWSRVYYYALFLSGLLADPPFNYDEIKEHVHEPGDLKKDLGKIQAWYDAHKDALAQASEKEELGFSQIRARLKE